MRKYFLKDYNRYIITVWIAIGIVFFLQFAYNSTIPEAVLFSVGFVFIAYPFTTYLSTTLLQNAMKKGRMRLFSFQFILISLTISAFVSGMILLFSYLGESGFMSSYFTTDGDSSIWREVIGSLLASLLINFGFCGLRFYEQNLKLQKELVESQLQILQAQFNPHFMFNVLNHVHVLIKREPDLADTLLLQYTDILRYQLYNGEKEYITIEQEVQFLKNFIAVEQIRWKNKLDLRCSWSVEDNKMAFPPLLLITFIENAFKHVSRSHTEKGYVNVDFEQKGGKVRLEVANSDSADKAANKDNSGIGLINIRKRLDIVFPEKYSLETISDDRRYCVKLIINR